MNRCDHWVLMLFVLAVAWPTVAQSAAPEAAISVKAEVEAEVEVAPADPPLLGWLELSGGLAEAPAPFAWADDVEGYTLRSVLDQIRFVAQSDRHTGLMISMDQPYLGMSQATAIAQAIGEARDAGKTVMTFAEVYGLNEYLIASAADRILLQNKGAVELHGLAVEEMYLAGMFEKIGVKPDLVQIGKYKGADETMMRSGPSKAWDQNFGGLLDDLYAQMVGRIGEGRGLTEAQVESLLDEAWAMTDEQLIENKVVDELVNRDMLEVTEQAFGEDFEWDSEMGQTYGASMPSNPMAMFGQLFQPQVTQTRRDTIALIHAMGPINSGDSTFGDGMFSSDAIGSRTLIGALEDALLDENIKGVVISIDSPGGSALASEVIWQAVREVQAQKPVYIAIGSMAASGGYYIACAADQIYVREPSIVGSIGVVGGKITMGGLYDWAGVTIHRRTRGPNADMFNSVEPFTDSQREQVKRSMKVVYEQFLDRVRTGRGDRLPKVEMVAEGRLFTGKTAIENGMADQLGGVDEALAGMAQKTGLKQGQYDVISLPAPMSFGDYISSILGVNAPSPLTQSSAPAYVHTARRLLGERSWEQVTRTMTGLMLLQHERTLTLMPTAIVIK